MVSFVAPGARVLVVDDSEVNLKVFASLLNRTRMQIETADSGDACIELFKRNFYDVIFLDHMMPDKDGIETLREMKACIDTPNLKTPVICLTANAISGMREMYMEAGFDDYLTKPIDTGKLENMLLQYLPSNLIEDDSVTHSILVVNDDVTILRQIKEWLSPVYNVTVVKTEAQAAQYLKNHETDLILIGSDIHLENDFENNQILRNNIDLTDKDEVITQVKKYFDK